MTYLFGDCELDTGLRELRKNGHISAVEPKVFDLLLYLVENRDRLVDKDELNQHIWKGQFVSDAALSTCIKLARQAIGDSGKRQDYIRTVPRRGFRFVGSVEVLDPAATGKVIGVKQETSHPRRIAAAAALVVLIAAGGVLAWFQLWEPGVEPTRLEHMAFPLPDKPSIAVLPFENLSDDRSQDYFADGMGADLITDLSKLSGLFVIARNTSFAYKGKVVKVHEVAEQLGVRYILEGSVRRDGERVRINAELIDSTTGGHLWSERYDGTMADVFGLQDKVTAKIVEALALHLTPQEQQALARRGTTNADAYDAYLQGWQLYLQETPESFSRAIDYFEEALQLDPAYSRAHAALANLYFFAYMKRWGIQMGLSDSSELRRRSDRYLDEALKNPTVVALGIQAIKLRRALEHEAAVAKAREAVALDPNDPDGHLRLATELVFAGDPQAAIPVVETAKRLDPLDEVQFAFTLGLAHLGLGQPSEAAEVLKAGLAIKPDSPDLWFLYAAAAGLLDDTEAAAQAVNRLGELRRVFHLPPNFYTTHDVPHLGFRNRVDMERIDAGLRKAGLTW
jgi:TolB-like protein/DNA-binding winged helix-turn-helix (wHTH) protein